MPPRHRLTDLWVTYEFTLPSSPDVLQRRERIHGSIYQEIADRLRSATLDDANNGQTPILASQQPEPHIGQKPSLVDLANVASASSRRALNCRAIYTELFRSLSTDQIDDTLQRVNAAYDRVANLTIPTRRVLCGLVERAVPSTSSRKESCVIPRDVINHLGIPEDQFDEEIHILNVRGFVEWDSHEELYTVSCPGADWNVFAELRKFAEKKGQPLGKLIVDLDFSLLDEDVVGNPSTPIEAVAPAATRGTVCERVLGVSGGKSLLEEPTAASHPTCFISYSWDSNEHKGWVRRLATELKKNGVATRLDQWNVRLGMDLPQYMETSIQESDFVLLVCTPNFALKADKGKGGVGYEKTIVTGEMYQGADPCKFTPILRSGTPDDALPSYLKSKAYGDFRDDARFPRALESVLRHFFGEPEHPEPSLGGKPTFKAIERATAGRIVPTQLHQQPSDGPSDDPDDSCDASQGKDDVY